MRTKRNEYQDYDTEMVFEAAAHLASRENDTRPRSTPYQECIGEYDDELRHAYLSSEEIVLLSILKARS